MYSHFMFLVGDMTPQKITSSKARSSAAFGPVDSTRPSRHAEALGARCLALGRAGLGVLGSSAFPSSSAGHGSPSEMPVGESGSAWGRGGCPGRRESCGRCRDLFSVFGFAWGRGWDISRCELPLDRDIL